MADLSILGQRIKQLRQELKLSQRDFAEKIGVTASALSAYEKGQKNPSAYVAINIASEFNVSLDWLCGLKEEASKFKPDEIINFDLPNAIFSLLKLINSGILSIPQTEELEEYGIMDSSRLEVTNSALEYFLHDYFNLANLYANQAISYENLKICEEEMVYRAAESIRKHRKWDMERREKEIEQLINDTNPFA